MASTLRLRTHAEAIWRAGVAAVDSQRLVCQAIERSASTLVVGGHDVALVNLGRIVVVGAGKAGAGMAEGVERAVGDDLLPKLTGWVNVPADCVRPLQRIALHAARPAGLNEPTAAGVEGTRRILELVAQLGPRDLCIVLLSGGGSALLPAPVPAITLEDKQAVTRLLMHAGASIEELNCVRKQLSQVKGGGLARTCTAGTTIALIISDVVGDPLDVIASGPTVADHSTAADALAVLQKYDSMPTCFPQSVIAYLEQQCGTEAAPCFGQTVVFNEIIGSNRVALDTAARQAAALGYSVCSLGSGNRGEARVVGRELAAMCCDIRNRGGHDRVATCVLSGGEPVVHLAPTDLPRRGGRNQELVLAALAHLWDDGLHGMAILSGGTDGEDGPTDAAGAVADEDVRQQARAQGLLPADFLAINNAYPFFEATGGLLKTGPTHTNVMDLRVALVEAGSEDGR